MKRLLLGVALLAGTACGGDDVPIDAGPVPTSTDAPTTSTAPPATTSTTKPEPEPVTTVAYVAPAPTAPRARATTTVTYYEPRSPQGSSTRGDTPPEYVKQCESGGDYRAVNPNGHYGAFQFSQSTWDSTAIAAGRGDLVGVRPDRASVDSQDQLAAVLWDNGRGASHWECA